MKLSIIIPVYNTEKYISRCLDTIICNQAMAFEIIIINDGSTDKSDRIIREYIAQHKKHNIRYINLDNNEGVGNARNIGLSVANGEYISFIDSDDWVDVDFHNVMIRQMDEQHADIAICGVKNELKQYNSYRYQYEFSKVLNNTMALEILSKNVDYGINISSIVCNKIFRKELLINNHIQFPLNSYNEDDYLTFISFLLAKRIIIVNNCYYHYYQREGSITHSYSKKHIDDLFSTFSLLKKDMEDRKLFIQHKSLYYTYLWKCFKFVISSLFKIEQNHIVQKYYLHYMHEAYLKHFTIAELFDNIDTSYIRNILKIN